MKDEDQKLIFEAYQQLNEIGGGGFNPSGRPEDYGSETFDGPDWFGTARELAIELKEQGINYLTDDEDRVSKGQIAVDTFIDRVKDILHVDSNEFDHDADAWDEILRAWHEVHGSDSSEWYVDK